MTLLSRVLFARSTFFNVFAISRLWSRCNVLWTISWLRTLQKSDGGAERNSRCRRHAHVRLCASAWEQRSNAAMCGHAERCREQDRDLDKTERARQTQVIPSDPCASWYGQRILRLYEPPARKPGWRFTARFDVFLVHTPRQVWPKVRCAFSDFFLLQMEISRDIFGTFCWEASWMEINACIFRLSKREV